MSRFLARARTYDFHSLPTRVQERFVAAISGRFPPRPTLHVQCETTQRRTSIPWTLGAVAATVALLAVGFGDVGRAHQPIWVLAPLAALVVIACFAGRARSRRETPYTDGWYVFPTTVVRAAGGELRKYPLEDLCLRRNGARVEASLGLGAAFELETFDPGSARALLRALTAPPPRPSGIFGEAGDAALLDPLADADGARGLGLSPLLPSLPRLAFAVIVAGALHVVRDRVSDEVAFAHARTIDDPTTWTAYLADGRYAPIVRDHFLPHAELRAAVAAGSLGALARFSASHPGFGVAEVKAARRRLLLEDLGQASATLATLAAFETRNPDHGLDLEVRRVRRSIYRDAVVQVSHSPWQGALAATPPKLARLLYAAEAHGPRVAVRFVAEATPDLTLVDAAVTHSARFAGTAFLPSYQLDGARKAGEKVGVTALRTSMRDWLGELVELVPESDGGLPPAVTLDVIHAVDAAGLLDGPGPALPALTFRFRLVLKTPGAAPEALAAVSITVDRECVDTASAKAPDKAYAAMARWAFRELGARLLGTSPAAKPSHDCAS